MVRFAKILGQAFLLLLGLCFVVAVWNTPGKYNEFREVSRVRGCGSNQNCIDKAVAVWESQHVDIPVDRDIWIDFATDGTIARVSPDLEAWSRRNPVPAADALRPGSKAIYQYLKDINVFCCPQRGKEVGYEAFQTRPAELHYRWYCSKNHPGRTRVTVCIFYGEVGPRENPDDVHAW